MQEDLITKLLKCFDESRAEHECISKDKFVEDVFAFAGWFLMCDGSLKKLRHHVFENRDIYQMSDYKWRELVFCWRQIIFDYNIIPEEVHLFMKEACENMLTIPIRMNLFEYIEKNKKEKYN